MTAGRRVDIMTTIEVSVPDYRRWHANCGVYFFTIVTYDRRRLFDSPEAVELLRLSIAAEMAANSFVINAAVVLPDHAHFIWTLPVDDADYSSRIGRIKAGFTKRLRAAMPDASIGPGRQRGYSSIWQPRFWEHVIRDGDDLHNHVEYIHYNPVRHGYCRCPHDWAASSFNTWVAKGWRERTWCCGCDGATVKVPDFDQIAATIGE